VNDDDVGVIEGGRGLCFLNEAAHPVLILGEFFGEKLERDVSIKLCVASEKNLAHPARADRRDDVVSSDFLAC